MDGEQPFDYICWDLYARTSQHYKDHPEALVWRAETLHAIEAGTGELAEMAHLVADAIVNAHLATMLRLNIQYDVLPRESEILHLQFWAAAFELLKQRQAIYFEEEGKNKGCWVMPSSSFREEGDANEDSKVIVRSNGTVTYVGKDIAYQLWKFGLLGKDFYYRLLTRYTDGKEVWVSTDEPQPRPSPAFRQRPIRFITSSIPGNPICRTWWWPGCARWASKSRPTAPFISPTRWWRSRRARCADLGIELSEEDARRPYVEMSGRKGLGVKADDLMDKLIESALAEVASRHAEDNEAAQKAVATEIAMGALRYFLLKFTRNTVIAFDFQEALSFEGETGPYVQYAAVRARNILLQARRARRIDAGLRAELTREAMARQLADEDSWQVLLAASKADSAVERAVTRGRTSARGQYAFQLAQEFSNFYQHFKVLDEPDRERRMFLLWMTQFFAAATGANTGRARHRRAGVHVNEHAPRSRRRQHERHHRHFPRRRTGRSPPAAHRPRTDFGRMGHSADEPAALCFARPGAGRWHHRLVRGPAAQRRAGGDGAAVLRRGSDVRHLADRHRA